MSQFKPVRGRENSIHQFRTELIKAVAAEIVARSAEINRAVDTNELHEVADRLREIEDMFERPAIDREVILTDELGRQRLAEIVNDGRALVRGEIDAVEGLELQYVAGEPLGEIAPAIAPKPCLGSRIIRGQGPQRLHILAVEENRQTAQRDGLSAAL